MYNWDARIINNGVIGTVVRNLIPNDILLYWRQIMYYLLKSASLITTTTVLQGQYYLLEAQD